MGEGVKIGGGTSLAIDGLEQIGELKLSTKWQWVYDDNIPLVADGANLKTPSYVFKYNGELYCIYKNTLKKIMNGQWVDVFTLPFGPSYLSIGSYCEAEGYMFFALPGSGKIYRFDGSECTLVQTVGTASSSTYYGNMIYDDGKLYFSNELRVYIISLSDFTFTSITAVPKVSSNYTTKAIGQIFRLKGKLYTIFSSAGGYLPSLMEYDESSATWTKKAYLEGNNPSSTGISVPVVIDDVAYISSEYNGTHTFDGNTVKRISGAPTSNGSAYADNGEYHVKNQVLKKVLCLEV